MVKVCTEKAINYSPVLLPIAQYPDVALSVAHGDPYFFIACVINAPIRLPQGIEFVLTEKYWKSFQSVSLIMVVTL